jgi:hypothetical protein
MTSSSNQVSEQQIQDWTRDAYQKATGFLAQNAIVTDSVSETQSRYLAPYFAIWKIKDTKQNWYWVLSGDLPTDFMPEASAESPRDALRVFSFRWQLKAENLRRLEKPQASDTELADLLVNRATVLYDAFEDDRLWKNG